LNSFLWFSNAWSEDLYFTIEEDNWELSILDLHAISLVEDVAQHGAFFVWVEGNRSALVVKGVGESEEVFASSESVEAVVSISLNLIVVEELSSLTEVVDDLQEVVDIRVSVHVGPKGLSVEGILTTTVGLLVTIVDNWDTNRSNGEGEGSSEVLVAGTASEETWLIVVVDEVTGNCDVRPGSVSTIIVVLDAVHGATVLEGISKGRVESVVQDRIKRTLVAGNVWKIETEDFTNGVDTSSSAEFSPEVLGNIRDSVDSEGIKVVGLDEVSSPLKESLLDEWMILIKIRKSAEPASFHLWLISGVDVIAVGVFVVVAGVIERNNVAVVSVINVSDVVGNNINHNPDVSLMASLDEFLQLFSSAELFVNLIEVFGPVAMISSLGVSNNG